MTPQALHAIKTRDYFGCQDNFAKTKDMPSVLVQGKHWQTPPVFTIVVPAYKKPQILYESVQSALAQPGNDYQILVVDDVPGGDPETQQMLRKIQDDRLICYANQQNLGLFANWNRCFELAQSEWVVMLHDDDVMTRDYLPWMRTALRAAPEANFIAVRGKDYFIQNEMSAEKYQEICAPSTQAPPKVLRKIPLEQLQFGTAITWQGSCIRRSAYLQMGGAELGTRMINGRPNGAYYTEDYCMLIKFLARYSGWCIPRCLYRLGVGMNTSCNIEEWQDALVAQCWCSIFLGRQHKLLSPVAKAAAKSHILRLADRYNKGNGYMGQTALDVDLLAKECEAASPTPTTTMRAADALWELYYRFCMAKSHLTDIKLEPPQEGLSK